MPRDTEFHWSRTTVHNAQKCVLAVGCRRVLKGFGSNAEGAMIRVNNSELLLFSHSNDINGTANRWNMTVWASADSGATWRAVEMVEAGLNRTALAGLHVAYSALLAPLGDDGGGVALAYERGPWPGTHGVPTKCGEYATIRWHPLQTRGAFIHGPGVGIAWGAAVTGCRACLGNVTEDARRVAHVRH